MRGKTVVVTGASGGIGRAASLRLAELGAEVIMVSRDPRRGAAARDEVAAVALGPEPRFIAADVSSQAAIRALAHELNMMVGRLDVLINNAGTASNRRELTVDGIERTLATNHLAPFLLTQLVLDLLLAAPSARIVNVTSESHSGRIDFENLQGERHYHFLGAYARSKLANVLFTYELARRLEGTTVTANCYTPGPTATNFGRGAGGLMGLMSSMVRLLALSPLGSSAEQGALPAVYLASSPEVASLSGAYFVRLRAARSKPVTYDAAVAARLWSASQSLIAEPGAELLTCTNKETKKCQFSIPPEAPARPLEGRLGTRSTSRPSLAA
jgi:NAD(P)-dependent dehydrogenase (short-subunit alcohol dehydrogenase family)